MALFSTPKIIRQQGTDELATCKMVNHHEDGKNTFFIHLNFCICLNEYFKVKNGFCF